VNLLHRRLCASTSWARAVRTSILPWVLDGVDLGSSVLEVGPGYGAATDCLRERSGHLTCVEIDRAISTRLAERMPGDRVTVLCEDATQMSLADATFDGAVSLAMLHHMPSVALQDRLLAEVARVLRPGGMFAGFDGATGPLFRLLHVFDTMTVIDPDTFAPRLAKAGFSDIAIDARPRGFRFLARRAGARSSPRRSVRGQPAAMPSSAARS
jgi:SAM-dependent methyltransferase